MTPLTLEDLMGSGNARLHEIMDRAHPLDPRALVGQQYLGVDLSLPPWVNRILWKTFRKVFVEDEETGGVRGWNVRMEQRGIDGPQVPMRRGGRPWTFAHYQLQEAEGMGFPRGWSGRHYLDYRRSGNPWIEGLGVTPLVAVNEGDMGLLLGWEIFRVGSLWLPLPDYWALSWQGPAEEVVPPPGRARRE